jgi:ribulose-phosphate 3-epimerase
MGNEPTDIHLAPSLICCDLCNLERELLRLRNAGTEHLHIDLIDAHFSPCMPMGVEIVRQARAITDLSFDVHLMVDNNELFIRELADIKTTSICIHYESAFHADRLLSLIQDNGARAGIALMPMTPLSSLDYCIERIDFVLLMLINPGYAGQAQEAQVPYAEKRVRDCRKYFSDRGLTIPIHVDGRLSFDNIPRLVAAGANRLVLGSRSLFLAGSSLSENLARVNEAVSVGIQLRGEL